MVSNARDDLPDPDTPVTTDIRLCGMSSEMFLRLWTRAPRIRMESCTGVFRQFQYTSWGKRWGGPPGPRGSPWTRSSLRSSPCETHQAGQGAGRGPGGPPHNSPGSLLEQQNVQPAAAVAGDDLLPPSPSPADRKSVG